MATLSPPVRAATAGIPTRTDYDVPATHVALIAGHEPDIFVEELIVAASQTIAAYTPVGFDGSGRLVPAVFGTTQAIGITIAAITTDSSTNYRGIGVYRGGCFNKDAITWPASYDTDAKKVGAFRGAPTPTSIVVKTVKTYTP